MKVNIYFTDNTMKEFYVEKASNFTFIKDMNSFVIYKDDIRQHMIPSINVKYTELVQDI